MQSHFGCLMRVCLFIRRDNTINSLLKANIVEVLQTLKFAYKKKLWFKEVPLFLNSMRRN